VQTPPRLASLAPLLLAAVSLFPVSANANRPIPVLSKLTPVWTYQHPSDPDAKTKQIAEISAYDPRTRTLWVIGNVLADNGDGAPVGSAIDVLDAATGNLVEHIDVSDYGYVNSVAVSKGIAAVAVESKTRTANGQVLLFDTRSRDFVRGVHSITVGPLPDMLTFTDDGRRLLVANEGTPSDYSGYDPAGSVSVIDMSTRKEIARAGFDNVPTEGTYLRDASIVGMDFEPEYITVSRTGQTAYVTLQEANAIGVLNLRSKRFTKMLGLGVKDFSLPGNAIDPNHKDGKIELRPAAVKGLYQPDGIAAYTHRGATYLVMANEGDTREDDGDKARVKDSGLTGYPEDLAQLNVSTVDSTSGTDLVTFGGRSFSIRDTNGSIVFDSGNRLDAKAIELGIYDDSRSDDKGVEPEGVKLFEIDGRTLAFIGLERTTKGAVAVFDVTDPADVIDLGMVVSENDISPEGLEAFRMNGRNYLVTTNEVSGTTSLFELELCHSNGKGRTCVPSHESGRKS
jgi:hypothetical protein